MGTDLTGGLGDDREFVFAEQPADPEMRESVNAWIWDSGTQIGLPRIGVEAVADQWETHDIQVNIATADGRVFNVFGSGKVHDPLGPDGKPRVLGARTVVVRVGRAVPEVEDAARRRGRREHGHRADRAAIARHGRRACRSRSRSTSRSAVPPWENGALLRRGEARARRAGRGRADGRPPLRAAAARPGPLRIGDARARRSTVARSASAARASAGSARSAVTRGSRRCSRADVASATSSIPSATTTCPPTTRATSSTVTAISVPAWVVDAPWLRRLQPRGEDVSVVLGDGERHHPHPGRVGGVELSVMGGVGSNPAFPVLQQAIARYTWDDETANGMMERSMPGDQIDRS